MRQKILAANWKMHKTVSETLLFLEEFKKLFTFKKNVEIVIAPSFTSLDAASKVIKGSFIKLSAQNMYWQDQGAFTGEISPLMLKAMGCEYVILGHSERRHVFFETDAFINQKVLSALKHNLFPIFCIGEKIEERQSGKTFDVLQEQLTLGLKDVSSQQMSRLVIAYEPVWAIGTGKVALASQAEEAHQTIRKMIWDKFGMEVASEQRIIYGGSIKPENFSEMAHQPNIDGALVGGSSLNVKSFIEILKQMA